MGGSNASYRLDNEVGVIELVMNPKDPAVLYAAAYNKERTAGRLGDLLVHQTHRMVMRQACERSRSL